MGLLDSGFGLPFKFSVHGLGDLAQAQGQVQSLANSARQMEQDARSRVATHRQESRSLQGIIQDLKGQKMAAQAVNDTARVNVLNQAIATTKYHLGTVRQAYVDANDAAREHARVAVDAERQIQQAQQQAAQQSAIQSQRMMLGARGLQMAGGAITGAGMGAASFMQDAVGRATSFEGALAGLQFVLRGSESDMSLLKGQFLELNKVVPGSLSTLAQGATILAKAGVPLNELAAATQIASQAASAEGISITEAADALNSLRLAYKESMPPGMAMGEIMARVASSALAISDATPGTLMEISEMGKRAAATATQLGLTAHEALAFAGTMTELKISPERGGSELMNFFGAIQKNEKLILNMADSMGIAMNKPWTDMRPVERAQTFAKVLLGMKTAVKEGAIGGDVQADMLKKLGLGGVRGSEGANAMAIAISEIGGESASLTKLLSLATESFDANTFMQKKLGSQSGTLAFQTEQLSSSWDNFKTVLGEALVPVIKLVTQTLGGLSDWLNDLSPLTKQFIAFGITGVAVFGLVIGPLLLFGGTILIVAAQAKMALATMGADAMMWSGMTTAACARIQGAFAATRAASVYTGTGFGKLTAHMGTFFAAAKMGAGNMVATLRLAFMAVTSTGGATALLSAGWAALVVSLKTAGAVALKFLAPFLFFVGLIAVAILGVIGIVWSLWTLFKYMFPNVSKKIMGLISWVGSLGSAFEGAGEWVSFFISTASMQMMSLWGNSFAWVLDKLAWVIDGFATLAEMAGLTGAGAGLRDFTKSMHASSIEARKVQEDLDKLQAKDQAKRAASQAKVVAEETAQGTAEGAAQGAFDAAQAALVGGAAGQAFGENAAKAQEKAVASIAALKVDVPAGMRTKGAIQLDAALAPFQEKMQEAVRLDPVGRAIEEKAKHYVTLAQGMKAQLAPLQAQLAGQNLTKDQRFAISGQVQDLGSGIAQAEQLALQEQTKFNSMARAVGVPMLQQSLLDQAAAADAEYLSQTKAAIAQYNERKAAGINAPYVAPDVALSQRGTDLRNQAAGMQSLAQQVMAVQNTIVLQIDGQVLATAVQNVSYGDDLASGVVGQPQASGIQRTM